MATERRIEDEIGLLIILIIMLILVIALLYVVVNKESPKNTQSIRITNGDFDEKVHFIIYINAIVVYEQTLEVGDTLEQEIPVPDTRTFTFGISNGNQSLNIRFTYQNTSTAPPDVICIVMTHEGIFWSNPTDTGAGGV